MSVTLEEAAKHAYKLQNEGLIEKAYKIYPLANALTH